MNRPSQNPSSCTEKQPDLPAENQELKQELASVKRQLNGFKQQLFGQQSEKRLMDDSGQQGSLFEALINETSIASESLQQTITYQRGKGTKLRDESCVTEQGLRFDDPVPVELITLEAPELKGQDVDHYRVIDYKITRRLAQRPSSYDIVARSLNINPPNNFKRCVHHPLFLTKVIPPGSSNDMGIDEFNELIEIEEKSRRNNGVSKERLSEAHEIQTALLLDIKADSIKAKEIDGEYYLTTPQIKSWFDDYEELECPEILSLIAKISRNAKKIMKLKILEKRKPILMS